MRTLILILVASITCAAQVSDNYVDSIVAIDHAISATCHDTLVIQIVGIADAHMLLLIPDVRVDTVERVSQFSGRWYVRSKCRMWPPILASAYQIFEVPQ